MRTVVCREDGPESRRPKIHSIQPVDVPEDCEWVEEHGMTKEKQLETGSYLIHVRAKYATGSSSSNISSNDCSTINTFGCRILSFR
jgi:hypothetical protein